MHYEESWINGKLMYRTSPNGTWYVCTTEQLYRRIKELQRERSPDPEQLRIESERWHTPTDWR